MMSSAFAPVARADDFSAVLTDVTAANTFYTEGVTLATTILGLPTADFADTALDNALSAIDQFILPDQIQFISDLAYMF